MSMSDVKEPTVRIPEDVVEIDNPSWRQQAACRGKDPNMFILERGDQADPALAICRICPVQQPCLQYALDNSERGIWGGTSQKQRRRMLKEKQAVRRKYDRVA